MTTEAIAMHRAPAGPARIWYQRFVDPQDQCPYMDRLQEYLTAMPRPPFATGALRPIAICALSWKKAIPLMARHPVQTRCRIISYSFPGK